MPRLRNQQQHASVINAMEFCAWLTAEHHVDARTLTAERRAEFENKFERAAASFAIRAVTGTPGFDAGPSDFDMDDPADLEAAQAVQDNENRLMEISEIAMNHLDIAAQAVRENWTLVETDQAVMEREGQTAGQYSGGW